MVKTLLDNAIKFTPTQGIIEVIVQEKESDVLVTISDTGCGIADQALPKIFDKILSRRSLTCDDGEMDWDCLLFMKL